MKMRMITKMRVVTDVVPKRKREETECGSDAPDADSQRQKSGPEVEPVKDKEEVQEKELKEKSKVSDTQTFTDNKTRTSKKEKEKEDAEESEDEWSLDYEETRRNRNIIHLFGMLRQCSCNLVCHLRRSFPEKLLDIHSLKDFHAAHCSDALTREAFRDLVVGELKGKMQAPTPEPTPELTLEPTPMTISTTARDHDHDHDHDRFSSPPFGELDDDDDEIAAPIHVKKDDDDLWAHCVPKETFRLCRCVPSIFEICTSAWFDRNAKLVSMDSGEQKLLIYIHKHQEIGTSMKAFEPQVRRTLFKVQSLFYYAFSPEVTWREKLKMPRGTLSEWRDLLLLGIQLFQTGDELLGLFDMPPEDALAEELFQYWEKNHENLVVIWCVCIGILASLDAAVRPFFVQTESGAGEDKKKSFSTWVQECLDSKSSFEDMSRLFGAFKETKFENRRIIPSWQKQVRKQVERFMDLFNVLACFMGSIADVHRAGSCLFNHFVAKKLFK